MRYGLRQIRIAQKFDNGPPHLLLSGSKYKSPWLTYNQAQELGGNVRKGEKSEFVVFWKFLDVEDKETR
jgi:antirestriction protein ArdC